MNIDPRILDVALGITYKRATLTRWEKVKILFRLMKEPQMIRIKPMLFCDLIPRVTFTSVIILKVNEATDYE